MEELSGVKGRRDSVGGFDGLDEGYETRLEARKVAEIVTGRRLSPMKFRNDFCRKGDFLRYFVKRTAEMRVLVERRCELELVRLHRLLLREMKKTAVAEATCKGMGVEFLRT